MNTNLECLRAVADALEVSFVDFDSIVSYVEFFVLTNDAGSCLAGVGSVVAFVVDWK